MYDAKRRCARLARQFWNDPATAARLEQEAGELKRRFNEDFWMPEKQFFALALDGKKRKVDSLTSNVGHLLWSGIADPDKADACLRQLVGPSLFSGWGVRTMSSQEGLEPVGDRLLVDPAVPKQIAWIEVEGIPGRWGRSDAFARGLIDINGAPATKDAREVDRAA